MSEPIHPSRLDWLSTAEVAELLAVSPATVKRWAEAGELRSERTRGGHRRFRREEVEHMRRGGASRSLPSSSVADSWIKLLLGRGPALAVQIALLESRKQHGSWTAAGEALGPVLEELGNRWARGEITVLQEHVAAERLARGLAWAAEGLPVAPSAPHALLATLPGEDHTLGLALVEVCLRELGWQTLWAGRGTPLEDLERSAREGSSDALMLSASVCAAAQVLAEGLARLGPAGLQGRTALVIGGRGAWPEDPGQAARLRTMAELRAWAQEFRPRRA